VLAGTRLTRDGEPRGELQATSSERIRELPEPSEPVTRRQTNSFWSDERGKLTAQTIEIRKMVYTHRKRVLETPDDE